MSDAPVPETKAPHVPQAANPPLVIIDTDALVQLLLVNEYKPLRELKRNYKVQPAIVEAVEVETKSPGKSLKKHVSEIEPRLQKALGNGTLLLVDGRSLPSVFGAAGAHALETQIAITGTRYHRVADYGEAYSHAAAAILGVPIMTHDLTAVRALKRAGERLGSQILRLFDLYTFSYQCDVLTIKECDDARQILNGYRERLPDAFMRRSFADGLAMFYPRLLDRDLAPIGSAVQLELYDVRLLLSKQVQC